MQKQEIKNIVLSILFEIKPNIDFENINGIIDCGILDSLDLIRLISELKDKFSIPIGISVIKVSNFNSVDAISNLVINLMGENK